VFALAGLLRRNILIISLIIVLFVSWHTWLPTSVVERINMTTNESGELDTSNEKRVQVWKSSTELFNSNRLTGIGFNTFPYLGLPLGDVHNLYLKILVEQGIVGFVIFLMIILTALFYGWKLYRRARDDLFKGLGFGFFLCTISLLISNFFGDRWTYLPLGAYYWAFMALVVRANIITQKEIQNKNTNVKKKVSV
jgi:O-antigen ligase